MYALHGYINVMNKNIFIARNFFISFPRCYFHIFIIYDCSWQEKKRSTHTHTHVFRKCSLCSAKFHTESKWIRLNGIFFDSHE